MKNYLVLFFALISIDANCQILGSEMHSRVINYINSKPDIVSNIKKSYTVDSYGKCLAIFTSYEADIIRGYLKPPEAMAFNLSVDAVALSIARQELLRKGVSQANLDASHKIYISQFKQKSNQESMTLECRNIAQIFLGEK